MPFHMLKGHHHKGNGFLKDYVLHTIKNHPKTGYEIIKEIGDKTEGMITPSKGTIYPILTSLEDENLIEVTETGPRSSKTYSITETGKETLEEFTKRRHHHRHCMLSVMMLFSDDDSIPEPDRTIIRLNKLARKKYQKDNKKTQDILKDCIERLEKIKDAN